MEIRIKIDSNVDDKTFMNGLQEAFYDGQQIGKLECLGRSFDLPFACKSFNTAVTPYNTTVTVELMANEGSK